MAATISSLLQRLRPNRDWSQHELAGFYRVEAALVQAGLSLETERGVSDEGEPWFAFCHSDTAEVFIHFARIDGEYVAASAAFSIVRSRDFSTLVRDLLNDLPARAPPKRREGNLLFHPSAVLIILVGAAFFHSSETKAAELEPKGAHAPARQSFWLTLETTADPVAGSPQVNFSLDPNQTATLMAGVLFAMSQDAPPPPLQTDASTHAAAAELDPSSPALAALSPSAYDLAVSGAPTNAAPPPSQGDLGAGGAPAETSVTPVADAGVQLPAPTLITPDKITAAALPFPAAPPSAASAPADHPLALGGEQVALPANEAGEVVADSGVLAKAAAPQHLDQLPADLSTLLSLGLQLDGGHYGDGAHPAAAATVSAAPPSAAPAPPTAASGAAPSHTISAHDAAIDAFVEQFIAHVADLEVIVSNQQIVIYDGQIFSPPNHSATPLESITFTFDDGSSISLVGTVSELLAGHALH